MAWLLILILCIVMLFDAITSKSTVWFEFMLLHENSTTPTTTFKRALKTVGASIISASITPKNDNRSKAIRAFRDTLCQDTDTYFPEDIQLAAESEEHVVVVCIIQVTRIPPELEESVLTTVLQNILKGIVGKQPQLSVAFEHQDAFLFGMKFWKDVFDKTIFPRQKSLFWRIIARWQVDFYNMVVRRKMSEQLERTVSRKSFDESDPDFSVEKFLFGDEQDVAASPSTRLSRLGLRRSGLGGDSLVSPTVIHVQPTESKQQTQEFLKAPNTKSRIRFRRCAVVYEPHEQAQISESLNTDDLDEGSYSSDEVCCRCCFWTCFWRRKKTQKSTRVRPILRQNVSDVTNISRFASSTSSFSFATPISITPASPERPERKVSFESVNSSLGSS